MLHSIKINTKTDLNFTKKVTTKICSKQVKKKHDMII
jgi:hypothetical protein